MKIPNANNIVVPRAKIVGYLLSETHISGRHKAVFFRRHGCRSESWQDLADRLRRHAITYENTKEEPSLFGKRFVVDGIIEMPDGRTPMVRTVCLFVGMKPRHDL